MVAAEVEATRVKGKKEEDLQDQIIRNLTQQ